MSLYLLDLESCSDTDTDTDTASDTDAENDLGSHRAHPKTRAVSRNFTMKIVLTMTMKARSQDQAEVLASHVAAFLPEDATRVAEAFSPVLVVPDNKRRTRDRADAATAMASVVLVTDSCPESARASFSSGRGTAVEGRLAQKFGSIRTGVTSDSRPEQARFGNRRVSLYTRPSGAD